MPDDMDVTVAIDNVYEGEVVKTTAQATVPLPPPEEEDHEDWAYAHIFALTGTGRPEGNSAYFVKVTASSRPDIVPVGTRYEWGL